ncbi:hypothetical protein LNP18_06100 [Leuconostoc citreum]|uniref:hypothetical protein n=1 Tax=Leuconostoc citreum TaxID=33964 RepID=UPI00200B7C58|nr:hypothetical protein [Leuconostoc citreum]MCK8605674.1 hypothetical protein [Leuconostoc citreum]
MYEQFIPGRNIWKKVSRWFFFTIERLIVIGIMLGFTLMCVNKVFPYDIGIYGLIFIVSNIFLTLFFILPSPSNPNGLMYQEIVRGTFKFKKPSIADIYATTPQDNKGDK